MNIVTRSAREHFDSDSILYSQEYIVCCFPRKYTCLKGEIVRYHARHGCSLNLPIGKDCPALLSASRSYLKIGSKLNRHRRRFWRCVHLKKNINYFCSQERVSIQAE